MKKLIILLLMLPFPLLRVSGQTSPLLIGEWKSVSSVNTKYSSGNCLKRNSEQTISFSPDGKYTNKHAFDGPQEISKGKYVFIPDSMMIEIYGQKWLPYNENLPDLKFKIISVGKKYLETNECFCVTTEGEGEINDRCRTKYKRTSE